MEITGLCSEADSPPRFSFALLYTGQNQHRRARGEACDSPRVGGAAKPWCHDSIVVDSPARMHGIDTARHQESSYE